MDRLDNGVIVCRLARSIETRCILDAPSSTPTPSRRTSFNNHNHQPFADTSTTTTKTALINTSSSGDNKKSSSRHSFDGNCFHDNLVKIDMKTVKCWDNAKSQSFYARDNVCNFIKCCRYLSVREAVIFESEDLVLHNNPRNVVLCLLEVARIACTRYSFLPAPGLVQLEQEIDEEIEKEGELVDIATTTTTTNKKETAATTSIVGDIREGRCLPGLHDVTSNSCEQDENTAASSEDAGCWSSEGLSSPRRTPSATSLVSSTSMASSTDASTFVANNNSSSALLISQLDQKVMFIAKQMLGSKKARHGIQRLAEGKYRIAGKIVFVRLLRDRHVMVRVGGGWSTLQQFLERHGGGEDVAIDISPSDLLPMDTRPSESRRRQSGSYNGSSFNSSISHASPDKPPTASNITAPTTALPVMRRCLSSTPASRRSSVSSPEPWSASSICSSGYNSSAGSACRPQSRETISRRSSICETPVSQKSQIAKRRSLVTCASEGQERKSSYRTINRSSLGLNLIASGSPRSITAPSTPTKLNNNANSTSGNAITNGTPVSGIKPPNRYPNYLSSSQHITSSPTSSSASSTLSSSSSAQTQRNPNNGQCNGAKAPAARRASLRAF